MTTSPAGDGIDPEKLARLVDVGLYAPIGLAVELERLLPELVAAGKRQVGFSRSLGRAALKTVLAAAAQAAADNKTGNRPEPELVIPADYDAWTAKQAIEHVRGAQPDHLEALRRHESAHKNRKTVLAAIDRMPAD